MKFSVMSRKAKPTARPAIEARPRIDSTTCVRPRAPSASRHPPTTSSELITEPRTDRSRTLPTNGESRNSDLAENRRASSADAATTPAASRMSSHLRPR